MHNVVHVCDGMHPSFLSRPRSTLLTSQHLQQMNEDGDEENNFFDHKDQQTFILHEQKIALLEFALRLILHLIKCCENIRGH